MLSIIWSFHIALDNHQFLVDFPMKKGHVHIAMLVYQRGIICGGFSNSHGLVGPEACQGRCGHIERSSTMDELHDLNLAIKIKKEFNIYGLIWAASSGDIGMVHSWDDFHGPRRKGPGSQPWLFYLPWSARPCAAT